MPLLPPSDPELPQLQLLLGPEACRVLEAALGMRVAAAHPTQIRYIPRRSVTVTYQVTSPDEDSPSTAVARSGGQLPAGSPVVSDGEFSIAVWNPRTDPRLPGLALALDRTGIARTLREVGLQGQVGRLRVRSYRPTRRAVVETTVGAHRVFVKVVRPERIAGLQEAHVAAAPHVRVPRSLGWSPKLGLAILEALPGRSLRAALSEGSLEDAPGWVDLAQLLDRLPSLPRDRPGLIDRVESHAQLLGRLIPEEMPQLESLCSRIGLAGAAEPGPAHNDFHSEQILVSDKGIGVIDIDTVGRGARIDDAALLIGHLFVNALSARSSASIVEYGRRLLAGCEEQFDRGDLRLRVAAAVLAFATAPFRSFQDDWPDRTRRRIEASREWVESAG